MSFVNTSSTGDLKGLVTVLCVLFRVDARKLKGSSRSMARGVHGLLWMTS